LVYGAGTKFTWDDTRLTAAALGIFAFGIMFQALIPFFARTFFAMQNTKIPTLISLVSVVLNMILAFFLVDVLSSSHVLSQLLTSALKLQGISDIRILALPLALTLAGMFQAFVLLIFLAKYLKEVLQKDLSTSLLKTGCASLVAGLVVYGILQLYGGVFPLTRYEEVLGQFILASLGGCLAYIGTAFLIKSPEILYFASQLRAYLTKKQLHV
jgi:putative peptidoglycan lipid II flippase